MDAKTEYNRAEGCVRSLRACLTSSIDFPVYFVHCIFLLAEIFKIISIYILLKYPVSRPADAKNLLIRLIDCLGKELHRMGNAPSSVYGLTFYKANCQELIYLEIKEKLNRIVASNLLRSVCKTLPVRLILTQK